MMYAPRRFRGLGVVNCHWEAFLQHFAIASKLAKHRDGLFHQVHDCAEEMKICKQKLGVEGNTSRALRAQLRLQAYEDWSKMPVAGVGVRHFQEFPKGNRFMYVNSSLSNSEWTTALKLSVGYGNVRGDGYRRGRQEDRKSTRLNSSHVAISYAVFCLKKKKNIRTVNRWMDQYKN